jgi:hypothetical protein
MQRGWRTGLGLALLAVVWAGCGSSANDSTVQQFISFTGEGITQADAVGANSADVDVLQSLCISGTDAVPTAEPYTQTLISAIFRNNEALDIQMQGYSTAIDTGYPELDQQLELSGSLSSTLIGGRCSNVDRQCGSGADCVALGGGLGTCEHRDSAVPGFLLFDFVGKAAVATLAQEHPQVIGQAFSLTVKFFGEDATRSWETSAGYNVTFGDYDNCKATSGGDTGGA